MSNAKILNRLVDIIESTLKLPRDRIDVDEHFETLGINSLIMMELIESIDQELDVALSPAMFADVETLSDLASLLHGLQAPEAAPAPAATARPDFAGHILRTYGIDLSRHQLDSLDDMADALVAGHADALMRHYGLAAQAPASVPCTQDIAIVGIACRLPDAPDAGAFWHNLMAGKASVREIPASRWDTSAHFSELPAAGKSVSKWGNLIDDVDCFDADFFNIGTAEAAAMDPQQRLLLQEAWRAVEDAGIAMEKLAGSRTGVFVGYQYSEYEQHLRGLGNEDMREGPLFSSSSPSYYLANRLSYAFDLRGPSEAFNVNCASSAVAINRACASLLSGESDSALAGGVSLNLFEGDYIASSQYGLLSPTGRSAVFGNDADGFTRGEGVAMVMLKRLADAEQHNDRIYAVIKASHQNYRGAARSMSEIRHESVSDALAQCYRKAGIDPSCVNYVEVDGYATKWADGIEYEGVKNALAPHAGGGKRCALGSVKGNIGNVEAASGVTSLIKLALSLHHAVFPPTVTTSNISTFIDFASNAHPLYMADQAIDFGTIRRDGQPIRAGLNSFADSGTNVHILLEEYRAPQMPAVAPGKQLFVLSAARSDRLDALCSAWIERLHTLADPDFAALAYTSQTGRRALGERLAIVAASAAELLEKLKLAGAGGKHESQGVFRASAANAAANPLAKLISASMARAQLEQSRLTGDLAHVAQLWVNGVQMPWEALWQGRRMRPVSLPGYPFARQRHWIDSLAAQAEPMLERPATGVATIAEWHIYAPGADIEPSDAAPMESAEKIALFLKQEVARQLHKAMEQIDAELPLVELGMNSVGIAELIVKLDALLDAQVSPGVLFRHPDINALSAWLAGQFPLRAARLVVSKSRPVEEAHALADMLEDAPAVADILVPVQPKGSKAPLFALPGAGGNALSLQQLSHALGSEQPFYCLEPVGLNGRDAPAASVAEAAAANIARMKSFQPQGPYRLLGYSNGGVVAFEMARQLQLAGDQVGALYLLDSLCPDQRAGIAFEASVVDVFNHFAKSLGAPPDLELATLTAVNAAHRSEFLHGLLARRGFELPKRQFVATFDVATASEHACRAYQPAPLTGKLEVVLVRAGRGYAGAPDDYGWNAYLAAPLRMVQVDADHFTLVERSAVSEVALALGGTARKIAKAARPAQLEASA